MSQYRAPHDKRMQMDKVPLPGPFADERGVGSQGESSMKDNAYESPESDVSRPQCSKDGNTTELDDRNAKYVVLALFLAPITTSAFYTLFVVILDIARGTAGGSGNTFSLDSMIGLAAVSLLISFVFSLTIAMPLNWLLVKIGKNQLLYFLVVGAVMPVVLVVLASREFDLYASILMASSGGVCSGVFWFVAGYLPSRQRP